MRIVKQLKALLPILLKAGYVPDNEGNWNNNKGHYVMTAHMLTQCGKAPGDAMEYAPDWLEEVIEYPCIMKDKTAEVLIYFEEKGKGVIITTYNDSVYSLGHKGIDWDMDFFELYATVTLIGELNAKENN